MADKQTITYDLCIVGAGMIGSAAARHASESQSVRVCLIGPEEPTRRSEATLFGAHYDEGRITRRTDKDPFWANAARSSIQRYEEIEQKSGYKFYTKSGCLTAGPAEEGSFVERTKQSAAELQDCSVMTGTEARAKYPYINFDHRQEVVHEIRDSGYINPRTLIKAQKKIAQQQGCDVIDDIVDDISDFRLPSDKPLLVTCHSGRVITTKKVLLATGAFTDFRKLLPSCISPDVQLMTQTVLYAEVPEVALKAMRYMPTLLYKPVEDEIVRPSTRCYVVPPIRYPDGKYYLKLGHGTQFEHRLHTEKDVTDWYRGNIPKSYKDGLIEIFKNVFPEVDPPSFHFDTGVTTLTDTKRPFIDLLTPRFGVALGGNGYAAKSCDELGRIAVQLIFRNVWDCPFDRESLKFKKRRTSRL